MKTLPRTTLRATVAMQKAAARNPPPEPAKPRISELFRSTRVGEVYWCDFIPSPCSIVPEFDDKHLVVIVRGGKKERDIHMVLPLTKSDQTDNPHGYKLQHNPNPGSANVSWAVCNHLYSVASERLELLRDSKGQPRKTPRIHDDDLHEISARVRGALMSFLSIGIAKPAEATEGAFGQTGVPECKPPT